MIKTIRADGKTEREAFASLAGRGGDGGAHDDVVETVRGILAGVRARGDAAVREYSLQFDQAAPPVAALTRDDMKQCYERTDKALVDALCHAAENIRAYHKGQVQQGYEYRDGRGCVLGQTVRGLEKVGLYVPGGRAAYPSTVLMNAIPAKLAGVGQLVMATPPGATDAIIAAAFIAGVDSIVQIGGAQAVAALAYGTETIPKVDKIVGPGNVYVATAKRLVFGMVDIDMIAGPSEILVLADAQADPVFIAADLLSQAEHDPMSASVLLTTSESVAKRTAEETERQLVSLERQDIARESIEANGLIVL
ncbi:MAG: histidinol dehydrogenase, partial [Clostridiales Family XIII bacterium]|nr:histidinol dehydrogenase [Clostridiales Family XIII bacterium]